MRVPVPRCGFSRVKIRFFGRIRRRSSARSFLSRSSRLQRFRHQCL